MCRGRWSFSAAGVYDDGPVYYLHGQIFFWTTLPVFWSVSTSPHPPPPPSLLPPTLSPSPPSPLQFFFKSLVRAVVSGPCYWHSGSAWEKVITVNVAEPALQRLSVAKTITFFFFFSLFPGDSLKFKKTLIIPQGAVLLWSWLARKKKESIKLREQYNKHNTTN